MLHISDSSSLVYILSAKKEISHKATCFIHTKFEQLT